MEIDQAKIELQKLIVSKGTKTAAARMLGVSPSLITEITKGRRDIPKKVLTQLGFERVIVHVRSERVPHVMRAIEKAA